MRFIKHIDVKTLGNYVDENTVAIFCSAPDGVFGVFGKFNLFKNLDPVKDIAKYALYCNIACHVDCSYSAFLLNFDESAYLDEFDANFETEGNNYQF